MSSEGVWTIDEVMSAYPYTIGAEQTLARARRLMRDHGVRHLPVLHGGALVGVVTERDAELLEGLDGVDTEEIRVEDVMTTEPYIVRPATPLATVAREMARRKLDHALVSQLDTDLLGIFTTVDAMDVIARLLP